LKILGYSCRSSGMKFAPLSAMTERLRLGILVIGMQLSLGSVYANDASLSCDEFQKIYSYFQENHLRFTLAPDTNREDLLAQAVKKVPEILRDMGYSFLAPQFEKNILQAFKVFKTETGNPDISKICDVLVTSQYRAVFLKSYARLLDPYSDFYLSEELEIRSSVLDGEFVGVGIGTDPMEGYLSVNQVVEDGPAAGKLVIGDKILSIDGHAVKGLGELEIRQRIRGEKGTRVRFLVEREFKVIVVDIIRDRVQQRSVSSEMVDNRLLMIRVHRFYKQTPMEVEAALHSHGKKIRGMILDLRNNPGGLLQAARDLVDMFISSGVVVYLKGKDVDEQVWAMNDGGYLSMPLVVLVNEGTASAAEIVAGALQDYGRAMVVGHRTYGKGSVQNIYETQPALGIQYRGGFKLTTMFYYLPSGRNVTRLDPDLVSASSERKEIDHPVMPYFGPDQIAVGNFKRLNKPWKFQGLDIASKPSEEIGKALLKRMLADSF